MEIVLGYMVLKEITVDYYESLFMSDRKLLSKSIDKSLSWLAQLCVTGISKCRCASYIVDLSSTLDVVEPRNNQYNMFVCILHAYYKFWLGF
jgi:hypothetical protein